MSKPQTLALDSRRMEFGAFLRSRRERLAPSDVGLPLGTRRRTPGLRREEVAMLANVGTTWYTWLEQGRNIQASIEVLTAVADVLLLDQAERRYLFTLADRPQLAWPSTGAEEVPAPVIRMLKDMVRQPAFVLGRRWDILAWNDAAVSVFGDFRRLEGDARNLVHLMFTNPEYRSLIADWDRLAPSSLAMFRADSARYSGDPDFARLISLLINESREFRAWWATHEVLNHASTIKRIQHPSSGELFFEYMSLDISACPGMRLIVCTPVSRITDVAA
jgi:transcriptional regulator with XRE-family HTH domain